MCSNGKYTERGIKEVDGFMAERWRIEPEYAVKVDLSLGILGVLLEPTTVVVKAWEHIAAIGRRTFWDPNVVLVTGAGPIGLLAALIAVQQHAEVHVLDRATSGPKPALAEALGATYHTEPISELGLAPDVVVECTGVAPLVRGAAEAAAPGAIICLTGVGGPIVPDASSPTTLLTDAVLKNFVLLRVGERQPSALLSGWPGARQVGSRVGIGIWLLFLMTVLYSAGHGGDWAWLLAVGTAVHWVWAYFLFRIARRRETDPRLRLQ